jgi:hypothetical protein
MRLLCFWHRSTTKTRYRMLLEGDMCNEVRYPEDCKGLHCEASYHDTVSLNPLHKDFT